MAKSNNYQNVSEIDHYDGYIGDIMTHSITLARVNGVYVVSYRDWAYNNNTTTRVYKSLGKAAVAFKRWTADKDSIPQ